MNVIRKPGRMTMAEFLDWRPPAAHERLWMLADGEAVEVNAPSVDHGAIQAEIGFLLTVHLRSARPECRVIVTPGVVPRVRAAHNLRIPDLCVVCGPAVAQAVLRDPVAVIGILSPSNEDVTRANVWTYASIPQVRDILLVDSLAVRAELLRREPDGAWPDNAELIGPEGEVELASLGFRAPLRGLYRTSSLSGPASA